MSDSELIEYTSDKETTINLSKEITVRFPLTKGEGRMPDISQFTENELSDLRSCLSLDICWEPELLNENQEAKILSIEILYDGITHITGEPDGYWHEDNYIHGYPAPIIRFFLDQEVDQEEFIRSIYTSSIDVITELMRQNDEESFHAEDQNGYTSFLSDDERDETIEYLKTNGVFSGKTFNFPDGLPSCGYSIPGIAFILSNSET